MSDLKDALDRALGGGPERHHDKAREQGKLPVRERVDRLLDQGSFVEQTSWVGSVALALVSVLIVVWLFGHLLGMVLPRGPWGF